MEDAERKIINILSDLKHRIFPRPFERLGVGGTSLIGAEIGVYKGEHAQSLLETLSLQKLFLVDPYRLYNEYLEGKSHYGVDQDPLDVAERDAKERLSPYREKIHWIRKKSEDSLGDLPNDLDFVYIDGNHQYEFIARDLNNFFEKLKEGGVLGGHDFYNGFCTEHDGVIQAVTEFSLIKKLKLSIELPDWWVVKGRGLTHI